MESTKTSPIKGLTVRQARFANAYFSTNLNTRKAMRIAGYSESTNPDRVRDNPAVAAYIQRQARKVTGKLEITRERVVAEMGKIAYTDMREFAEWGETSMKLKDSETLDVASHAAVKSISIKPGKFGPSVAIRLHDKVRALEKLGQWVKLGESEKGSEFRRIHTGVPHHEPLPEDDE